MIPIHRKMNFLKYLLSKDILSNDIAYTFFKELYDNTVTLNRIHFTNKASNDVKYLVTINMDKKYILIRINGKFHKSYRMLRYVERALKENKDMNIQFCIICSKPGFSYKYDNVVSNVDLVEELIVGCQVDYVTNLSIKEMLMKQIDDALDKGDKETFMKISGMIADLNL